MNPADRHDDDLHDDLRALAEVSARDVPTLDDTARALSDARATRTRTRTQGATPMRSRRRTILMTAGGLAASALVMLCPVPYTHDAGWDVSLRAASGRVANVRVEAPTAEAAVQRASALAGVSDVKDVTVAPRREVVWGSVYAMAMEKILHVTVDTKGKTDDEVASEIRAQLAQQGWSPDAVQVQSGPDGATIAIGASDGQGHTIQVVRRSDDADARVHIAVGDFDDTREPGMTDAQLREKILRQLRARGMDAEVTVDGDRIQIRATKAGP
jgi:hypothetical protein